MAIQKVNKATFQCLVRDRERVLYDGEAVSLTAHNETGKFDILPEHTHFISIIDQAIEVVKADGQTMQIPISKGILKVYENVAKVYLGIFNSSAKK